MASPLRFKYWLVVLLPLFLLQLSFTAGAARYQGEGVAYIVGQDLTSARELASETALHQGLEAAMQALAKGDAKTLRAIRLRAPELIPAAIELVRSQHLLSEQRRGKSLTVRLEIDLDPPVLTRLMVDKGLFAQQTESKKIDNLPSVMVVLSEELSGRNNPTPFSLHTAIEHLSKAGFRIVDPEAIRNSIAHDQAVQALLRGDPGAAQAAALQFGAALVITGKATAQKSMLTGGGMQVYGANISLRAYQADSGAVLGSGSGDGSFPHINAISGQRNALEQATDQAMAMLVKSLKQDLRKSGDVVAVSVSGVSYYQLSVLKKIMKRDFKEIRKMKQRGFSAGVARLDITVEEPQQFADNVVQKNFGTFRLDVLQYSPHKIDFLLITPTR